MERGPADRSTSTLPHSAPSPLPNPIGFAWSVRRAIRSGRPMAECCTTCRSARAPAFRSLVRARRFSRESAGPEGEPLIVYATAELVMPAYLPGTAPIATADQIICALGDYRGDIWLMDL